MGTMHAPTQETQIRKRLRRHHLIEEAKTELDVAYDEVKRAEQTIMELEHEYNERIHGLADDAVGPAVAALTAEKESRQEEIRIDALYELQGAAVDRFAAISAAFAIVHSVEDVAMAVDLVRNILFAGDEVRARKVEIDRAIRDFVRGLRTYSREDSGPENDQKVRVAWMKIEDILRDFGRKV